MNILIIGELSGLSRNLKNGFSRLGHNVMIVQDGDGWKSLAQNGDIIIRDQTLSLGGHHVIGSNRFLAVKNNLLLNKLLNKLTLPDIIVVVNYVFLRENITDAGVSCRYIRDCVNKGAKLIMIECGSTPAGQHFDNNYYGKLLGKRIPLKDRRYTFLLENSNVIIPTSFCYYEQLLAYEKILHYDTTKVLNSIPLPITVKDNINIKSCCKRKIVVFHGVIRPEAKGTSFIKTAMERLQSEMPDKVECICRGGLPYDEYIRLFDDVDILIDQTYLNGWGMNAVIGAMNGKCVLTSCGPENGDNMGIDNIPFVRITPDADKIYKTLKELIENPIRIESIKKESRKFAEDYCDSVIIANRYLASVNLL